MKNSFTLLLLLTYGICSGQNSKGNKFLDSTLSTVTANEIKVITIINQTFRIDTLQPRKIIFSSKDSMISITFFDKSYTKMKANYFWGIITYSGERERFYNGRLFTIVQPKPLYIYKIDTKNNSLNYFFSETLTGKIISLNKNNINNCTADSITKANLNEFLLANNYNINHAAEYTAVSETTIPVSDGNYTSPVKMSPIVAGFYILYEVTKAFKHEHNTKKQ